MNNSLKYVLGVIKEGRFGDDFPYDKIKQNGFCHNFEEFVTICIPELTPENHTFYTRLTSDRDKEINVTVIYNPNATFEYVSSDICTHDGTLMFLSEAQVKLLEKVLGASTYNIPTAPTDFTSNRWGYDIEYTVGDYVISMQNDKSFAPTDKPWMTMKQIVCLPIAVKYIKR